MSDHPKISNRLSSKKEGFVVGLQFIAPVILSLSAFSLVADPYHSTLDVPVLFAMLSLIAGVIVSIVTGMIYATKNTHPIMAFIGATLLSLIYQAVFLGLVFGACTVALSN